MTGRMEHRIERLEALRPAGTDVRYALARYRPPEGATDWLDPMLAQLAWPVVTFALVVIDANDDAPKQPEAVIAPIHYDSMTDVDRTRYLAAGRGSGRWYVAVTGRGKSEPLPMFDGQAAFLAGVRASVQQQKGAYFGDAL